MPVTLIASECLPWRARLYRILTSVKAHGRDAAGRLQRGFCALTRSVSVHVGSLGSGVSHHRWKVISVKF